jgi:hypothetical protein
MENLPAAPDNKDIQLKLEKDGSFAVKEFKALNAVAAAIFYIMFFVTVFNTLVRTDYEEVMFDKMLYVTIIPAVLFTRKALSKHVYLRVSRDGIFINEHLLTDWKGFRFAEYTQKESVRSISDNFILIVKYVKPDGLYMKEIPLTNTQDKAEEEVIAAVRYFYQQYRTSLEKPS